MKFTFHKVQFSFQKATGQWPGPVAWLGLGHWLGLGSGHWLAMFLRAPIALVGYVSARTNCTFKMCRQIAYMFWTVTALDGYCLIWTEQARKTVGAPFLKPRAVPCVTPEMLKSLKFKDLLTVVRRRSRALWELHRIVSIPKSLNFIKFHLQCKGTTW